MILRNILRVPLALCLIALALGFLGAAGAAFDSFSHLRVQLALGAFLIGAALAAFRPRSAGLVGMAAALAAFLTALPSSLPRDRAAAGNGQVLRFLHLNVRNENATPERVLALLESSGADVVALNEISDAWAARIATLLPRYPFQFVCARGGHPDAVAVLSRLPPWPGAAPRCAADGAFAAVVLEWQGAPLQVAAVHLFWPWPYGQAEQIRRLMPDLAASSPRMILAGDLNAVPWSAAVDRLAKAAGVRLVTGYGPTWLLQGLPRALMPLGLRIDQVFLRGLEARSARTLGPVGSDHLPVYLEIVE